MIRATIREQEAAAARRDLVAGSADYHESHAGHERLAKALEEHVTVGDPTAEEIRTIDRCMRHAMVVASKDSSRAHEHADRCRLCDRPTLGAFGPGPARNYWPMLCQTCKDEEDADAGDRALRSARMVSRVLGAVDAILGPVQQEREGVNDGSPSTLPLCDLGQGTSRTQIREEDIS